MTIKEKKSEMVEYVTKMAEQMQPSDISEMLAEYDPSMVIRLNTVDLPKPGPEIRPGEAENVLRLEDLPVTERIVEENNLLPVAFLEEGAQVQRAVCRMNVPGVGKGTGFMVSKTLLLTNNHVLPSATITAGAKAEFNFQDTIDGVHLALDSWSLAPNSVFYTNPALDFTLVRVSAKILWITPVLKTASRDGETWQEMTYEYTPNPDDPGTLPGLDLPGNIVPGVPDLTLPTTDPLHPGTIPGLHPPHVIYIQAGSKYGSIRLRKNISYVIGAHLNIIQHPSGLRKMVALQDNVITEVFANTIHYTTDTEPGSSGSPVFDNSWDLVALHHAGGHQSAPDVWIDNEGMRIDKIAADLVAHFTPLPGGAAILTELGL